MIRNPSHEILSFMRKSILLLLIVIVVTSCSSQGNRDSIESPFQSLSHEFLTWKEVFPDSLVNHFPNKIDTKWLLYNSSLHNSPENLRYLTLAKELSSKDRQKLEDLSHLSDSCLFEIYLRKNEYGFNYHSYSNCDSIFPVPEISLINEAYKAKDIKYYLIETSNKSYYDSESYLGYYLPDDWQNGLSRGIGVIESDSIIFYWTIMW